MTNKAEETTPNTIPKSKKAIVAKLQEEKTSTVTTNIMLTNKTYVLSSNFTSNTSYIIHVIARTSVGYGARHDPVKFTTSVDFQGKYILTILLDFYLYLIIGKYIHKKTKRERPRREGKKSKSRRKKSHQKVKKVLYIFFWVIYPSTYDIQGLDR